MNKSKNQIQYFLINTDIKTYKKRHFKYWLQTGFAYLTPTPKPRSNLNLVSTSNRREILDIVKNQDLNNLKKLRIGDYIFAYDSEFEKIKGHIVGVGRIIEEWDGILYANEPHAYYRRDELFYKIHIEWVVEKIISYEEIKKAGLHITPNAFSEIKPQEAKELLCGKSMSF